MLYMIKLSRQAGLGATPEGLLTKVEEEVKVRKESSFSNPRGSINEIMSLISR